jgi:hypothetical protein
MKLSWRHSRLLLSAVVVAGTLSGLTVAAAPAYAAGPQITVIGGPGEIEVQGGGFNADATVKIEARKSNLATVLETVYVQANWLGYIDDTPVYLNNLGGYIGTVYVDASGAPGPTAWAVTSVTWPASIQLIARTPPDCYGNIQVFGYGFEPGATVQVELFELGLWPTDYYYTTADQYGLISSPNFLRLSHGFDGLVEVVATEYWPLTVTAKVILPEAC